VSDEEFIGPLAGWVNARTDFGAVGDGVADDTEALQKGLDSLNKFNSTAGPATLYVPPGHYRITRTLRMRLNVGANVIGAGAAQSVLEWSGETQGTMLLSSGAFDTLFMRLGWDGRKRARIGIAQWWNFTAERANYQGSIKHVDEAFHDLGIGIAGGRLGADYGQGDSETLIERVAFRDIAIAGVDVGSFNALNWWIWDSTFIDCARGVSNATSVDDKGETAGAGTFSVYRSRFERSTVADAVIGNTGWFGFYGNTSIGSRRFLLALANGANGGPILAQNNTVIDTLDPAAISMGNEGPLILLDNTIRSRAGVVGPVVRLEALGSIGDRDVISVGNRFTTSPPISYVATSGRILAADSVVAGTAITVPPAAVRGSAPDLHRRIFEVEPVATPAQMQAAIDAAATSGAVNPVVHIPAGNYHLNRPLVIPANSRLQLAGDSEATKLWWTGPAGQTMLTLEGPSYATVRDICLVGGNATAIAIRNADQAGGRIFIEGSRLAAVQITGLRHTQVDAQANSGIARLDVDDSASVLGIAGFGPLVINGDSNVLESDNWYEGDESRLVEVNSGTFTYLGGEMAPYSHGVRKDLAATEPVVKLQGFQGSATFIGATLDLRRVENGIDARSADPGAYALFLGVTGTLPGYFRYEAGLANVGLVLAKLYVPGKGASGIPDLGRNDLAFLTQGLQQARSVVWDTRAFPHTPGATDVRLFRVFDADTRMGLRIEP